MKNSLPSLPVRPALRTSLRTSLVVAGAVLLAACSASVDVGSGYDPDEVADQVADAQREATPDLEISEATCPDDVEIEEGATFECTISIEGVEAPYTVTVEGISDDVADLGFAPAQAIIDTLALVDFVAQAAYDQGAAEADADCGADLVIVAEPGSTIVCTLYADGGEQDVELEVKDTDGNVALLG